MAGLESRIMHLTCVSYTGLDGNNNINDTENYESNYEKEIYIYTVCKMMIVVI